VAEAGYDYDDLAWGAIQIATTCRSRLKTTTLAQGGHQLRNPPHFPSKTPAFRPENKRVTLRLGAGPWHGSCFLVYRIYRSNLGFKLGVGWVWEEAGYEKPIHSDFGSLDAHAGR
jgi:hypothetical protein